MIDKKAVSREILIAFWKVHILHHAKDGGLTGGWMLQELRHHGYEVSPGTLYPLLKRMEKLGWLTSNVEVPSKKARRTYHITEDGQNVLLFVRRQLRELGVEVKPEISNEKNS